MLSSYSRKVLILSLVFLFAFLPVVGIAQEDTKSGQQETPSGKPAYVTMNFKDVDLQVFIKFISN